MDDRNTKRKQARTPLYPSNPQQAEQQAVAAARLHIAGAKDDGAKPDASLLQLFPRALLEVARVGTFGASKYSRGGWLKVPNGIVRYTAAMFRHIFSEQVEGTYDTDPSCAEYGFEGQIRHDAQVAWNALARLELKLKEEQDD